MQPHGSETSLQMVLLHRESSIRVRLSNCSPRMLQALRKFTFLRELEDGHSLPVLPDGPTLVPSGPDHVPASRLASQVKAKGKRTSATSGRNSTASLQPAAPTSLWESRLRQRLANLGSTECVLTWKASVTPAGRPLSRLVPSTRPTEGIDSGLWPTPSVAMATGGQSSRSGDRKGELLIGGLARMLWPTPTARDHFPAHNPEYIAEKRAQGHGMSNLNDRVTELWPTSTAVNHSGGAALCKWGGTRSREKLRQAVTSAELNGALNPAFPCWLMGFPTAREDCAPTETPSSRKSRLKSSAPISTALRINPPPC